MLPDMKLYVIMYALIYVPVCNFICNSVCTKIVRSRYNGTQQATVSRCKFNDLSGGKHIVKWSLFR